MLRISNSVKCAEREQVAYKEGHALSLSSDFLLAVLWYVTVTHFFAFTCVIITIQHNVLYPTLGQIGFPYQTHYRPVWENYRNTFNYLHSFYTNSLRHCEK